MLKTPREELGRRIASLQARMAQDDIAAALIVQNVDLYYFTGTVQQAQFLVPRDGDPVLFARKNPERVREESTVENIVPLSSPKDLPARCADFGYGHFERLGMELDVLPVNQYFRYLKTLRPKEIVDISPAIRAVRMVKSSYEIGLMEEVAVLADFMVQTAREALKAGVTEIEIAARVEAAARARGHQGLARMRGFNQEVYWGHLVAGPDAAVPTFVDFITGGRGLNLAFPSGSSTRPIKRHEPVVCDLCAVMYGYHVDQTRTMSVGPLPDRLKHAYDVSLVILHALERMIRPGLVSGEIFGEGERIAASQGLAHHFMGYGSGKASFVGHGVGLELDEIPVLTREAKVPLEPGMVLAVEPKFTFPGLGVVGVEDNFVVTESGCAKLNGASYTVEVSG